MRRMRYVIPRALPATLASLEQRLQGAIALVSGRALANVERLFDTLHLPMAGLHGLERRSTLQRSGAGAAARLGRRARGRPTRSRRPTRARCSRTKAPRWRCTGAMHRRPPTSCSAFAAATLPRLPGYRLQHGHHVVELRPARATRAARSLALIEEPPFQRAGAGLRRRRRHR